MAALIVLEIKSQCFDSDKPDESEVPLTTTESSFDDTL